MLPKMSEYIKFFDKAKYKSFLIEDKIIIKKEIQKNLRQN